MNWLKWLFAYFFDCVHPRTTWPRRNRAGLTYLCCLDCGRELPYSLELMRVVTGKDLQRYHGFRVAPPQGAPRSRTVAGSVARLRLPRLVGISRPTLLSLLAAIQIGAFSVVVFRPAQLISEAINPAAVKRSAPATEPGSTNVIVVGFLGGFVQRQDPHHPEVRLIQNLQQEYPTAYFALFENHNIEEAYNAIRTKLQFDGARARAREHNRRTVIILFGHSWGGSAVVRLARKLDRDGIPVTLTVQVDSVAKPFSNDRVIPPNVAEAINFYQTHGLIHGRPNITAADPIRTRILGNFRRSYNAQPVPCRCFPWYSRMFTRGHIAIECDPDLWAQVKTLMLTRMSERLPEPEEPAISETRAPVASGVDDSSQLF